MPIGDTGWLAVASRGRVLAARLARPAAQAAVPLLAATERLGDLARDQERAVRSALLDEALEGSARRRARWRPAPPPSALDFTAPREGRRVAGRDAGALADAVERAAARRRRRASRHDPRRARGRAAPGRRVALPGRCRAGIGRPVQRHRRRAALATATRSSRSSACARASSPTRTSTSRRCCSAEVSPEHIRPRVEELLAPLKANPPLLEALVEYFARDMDVNATAEAMHVHPNTLRYRLGRVEKLLGRSLRQPATIAELTLALHAPGG